ncbi:sodium/proline symporter PutP [Billgrantia endophytica]|uniref:Sodium/proline symporter n=1 Tax=Billgrantia endophytica TaxID=2033802 RepID=A0A2N7U4H8_9GAMM|nr:sodium/proline symporter PutP [Halomonas endophytica]PMR75328.1 sodium/proline symporter PutP [Halomonas endophytica]
MSDQTFQLIAIGLYFVSMLAIGFYAYRQTSDLDDYMLAGRKLHPGVAALSAGASDMSGWLLMGLPGAIYAAGLVEAWIAIGLTIGAYLNWKFVAPRLRSYTEVSNNSITLPSFLENRFKDNTRLLRIVSGIIILIFFTFYVSSGMVAGGVFFEASFGTHYLFGMILVAGITLTYTLFGGFLGASLTDVAQGLLMLAALILVPIITIATMGGLDEVTAAIHAADAAHNTANPGDEVRRTSLLFGGSLMAVISAAAWGLGYFGQPHIIVRFMALRSAADAKAGRRIGISWMVLVAAGAVFTGLIGVGYFHGSGEELANPETVFLRLSQILFHPFVAGLVLAAVLAAIMSTVSSQLIVCSSALVEDIYKIFGKKASTEKQVMMGRMGVLVVAIVAGLLAIDPRSNILGLVGFAWAGFGAAFGPVILLSLFWRKLTAMGALSGMIVGAAVVGVWGNVDALQAQMYEIVPGFIACTLAVITVSLITVRHQDKVQAEFTEMESHL